MKRPEKKTIDEKLLGEFQELVKIFRPKFGVKNDIDVAADIKRLRLKSLTVDQRNNLLASAVYKLKISIYGKTGDQNESGGIVQS